MATSCLTPKQCLKVQSLIVDINNCFNQVLPAFDGFNKELSPGFCLIDNFPDHFFFHTVDHKDAETRTAHCNKLKNIFKDSSKNKDIILVIFDVSIKNNIITLVSHIRREHKVIMKTIHHTMNVMFTKVELFAMRYGIS